jgi:N-acetylmuramoyl-L-alanine amidase
MPLLAAVFGLSTLLLFSSPSGEKRVSIYSNVANYSLPVIERDSRDYVGLLEALEPLGRVSATADGARWRLRYNNAEAEFSSGGTRVHVRGGSLDLSANFLLENGRGLVPLASMGTLLSRILGGPVTFHEASRRLFIGNVAVHFTAQISNPTSPSLVMNFTAPVNPMIATEPGKLRMIFSHEPLVPPGSPSLTFDSHIIPSATYEEDNGVAAITITAAAPLFASFSNGGRTITIAPAQPPAAPAPGGSAAPPPSATPAPAAPTQPGGTGASLRAPAPSSFFAVVDASHGGSERGAALSDQVAEKDVALAFARLLRREFEARGITTLILRDDDATLTLEQRANLANVAHPAIYICLHASTEGHGVRLYTALLPVSGANSGPFLDWDSAQSSFLPASQDVASSLSSELQRKQLPVRLLTAPLRPLNNIAAAAVAVEIAPPAEASQKLTSLAYQESVAGALAAGVLSVRDKLGSGLGAGR